MNRRLQVGPPVPSKAPGLTVVESGFEAVPSHRRAEAFRMNEGGWEEQVRNIRAYVVEQQLCGGKLAHGRRVS